MKTETIKRQLSPTAASLRELPEIDFTKYRIRRNPYAGRIKREGVKVVHDEPSAAALAEMPEVDFARVRRFPADPTFVRRPMELAEGFEPPTG